MQTWVCFIFLFLEEVGKLAIPNRMNAFCATKWLRVRMDLETEFKFLLPLIQVQHVELAMNCNSMWNSPLVPVVKAFSISTCTNGQKIHENLDRHAILQRQDSSATDNSQKKQLLHSWSGFERVPGWALSLSMPCSTLSEHECMLRRSVPWHETSFEHHMKIRSTHARTFV